MVKILLLLSLEIALLVWGQILWKTGVNQIGIVGLNNVMDLLISPYVWCGIAIYGLATLIWMFILSRANLSTVYPMQSLAYVFGLLAGIMLFGEKVTAAGWIGVLLIISGVFLTGIGLK
ncbi:MAG: hypothetical protein GXY40_12855 [Syntrophomonadaceae bacterium]|nr:hypothetical protein [Syntrophomonadaceae bacterium]